jgi:hypothetical protein
MSEIEVIARRFSWTILVLLVAGEVGCFHVFHLAQTTLTFGSVFMQGMAAFGALALVVWWALGHALISTVLRAHRKQAEDRLFEEA